jgi:ubiquinone/menaquinone biosynthesis C-methylase UbiE
MPSSRPVRISKAHTLLQPGVPAQSGGVWADLGCGDGIFTAALATLLGAQGEVFAVDKSRGALKRLQRNLSGEHSGARVHTLAGDFTYPAGSTGTDRLSLPRLDGVVVANALHFYQTKPPILSRIAALLKPDGRLIVVEYNTRRGNYAVPHPLHESEFLDVVETAGLHDASIISRIPSTFLGEMYAGLALAPSPKR